MELNDTLPRVKGMLFVGCSFTWGQGLWYYMNSPTVQEDLPEGYIREHYHVQHHAFKDSVRYPRLVAKHFNTFEIVHPQNSGANHQIVEYWTTAFKTKTVKDAIFIRGHNFDYTNRDLDALDLPTIDREYPTMVDRPMPLDVSDISHLVFQLTYWTREVDTVEYEGKEIELRITQTWDHNRPYQKMLLEKIEKEKISVGEYNDRLLSKSMNNIKQFLQDLENNGVKTSMMTWDPAYLPGIKSDPWLKERLIELDYKDCKYDCITDLMKSNPELVIKTDFENFKVPPIDSHPSLKCHQVMANSIIKFLEK